MKLAILFLLATGTSASFSIRRLQDSSGPHPGECNIDSDCIDEDHPEGICVPKAAHSHDHLRRRLFGGVAYSGYCMDLVCMAGESTFYQAHAEGLFAGDNNPIPVIQDRGWCDDGTTDGWVAYAFSSEAGCSAEVMGQLSGYETLSCQCPGLDWTEGGHDALPPILCSFTDDMPAICEETVKSLLMAETVAEQGQEAADNLWVVYTSYCPNAACPITAEILDNLGDLFCWMPAECEGTYRTTLEPVWSDLGLTWEMASSVTICSCGTSGGYKFPEGEDAEDGDVNILGWSGQSLCGETEECKNEALDSWLSAWAIAASKDGDDTTQMDRSTLEAIFNAVCWAPEEPVPFDPANYQGNGMFPKVLEYTTFWPSHELEGNAPQWGPEQLQEQDVSEHGDSTRATAFYCKAAACGNVCGNSVMTGSSLGDGFDPASDTVWNDDSVCWDSQANHDVHGWSEFFTLQFEHDVQAPTIDIYSNRGAGAVVEIDGWDYSTSTWINLWYASPTSTPMEPTNWFHCPMNGNTDRVMEACSIQCMCEQDITPDTSPLRTDGAACHNQDEFEERGLSVTPDLSVDGMGCFQYVTPSDGEQSSLQWLCSSSEEEVSYPGFLTTAEGDSGFCLFQNLQVRTCPATLETTVGEPTECWDREDSSYCHGVNSDGFICDEPSYRVDTYAPDYSTVSPEFRTDIIKVKMDTVTISDWNEIDYIRIY